MRHREQDRARRVRVRTEETPEQREQRLARERERSRARWAQIRDHGAAETPEQREQRLLRLRELDRACRAQVRAEETSEQTDQRLTRLSLTEKCLSECHEQTCLSPPQCLIHPTHACFRYWPFPQFSNPIQLTAASSLHLFTCAYIAYACTNTFLTYLWSSINYCSLRLAPQCLAFMYMHQITAA